MIRECASPTGGSCRGPLRESPRAEILAESYHLLESLRLPHGLYLAAHNDAYRYVWTRDVVYLSLPYLHKPGGHYERAFHSLLDLFRRYEWKIDIHTQRQPRAAHEYIHSRYCACCVSEIPTSWGHAQNDALGAFLWGVAAGVAAGKPMLRSEDDRRLLQKLVLYLDCLQYWECPDNGMWEEHMELHASSVGACYAALAALARLGLVDVPTPMIRQGREALVALLPCESRTKEADLALLSLIYPYRLVKGVMAEEMISRVESCLLRSRGVARYRGDRYYHTAQGEAEWTMGLPWLALCHLEAGQTEKARQYVAHTESVMLDGAALPEAYLAGTDQANPNCPLGWASALYILARERLRWADAVRLAA